VQQAQFLSLPYPFASTVWGGTHDLSLIEVVIDARPIETDKALKDILERINVTNFAILNVCTYVLSRISAENETCSLLNRL